MFSLKALDPNLMLASLMSKTVISISTEREEPLRMRITLKTEESILITMKGTPILVVPVSGGGRRRF